MKENKPAPAVKSIDPGSIAAEAGIEPGDLLLSINGKEVGDVFDYRFNTANENLLLEVQKKDGQLWELEIEKDEYEDLGLEFENSMLDEAKSCSNKCIFCFIDQLPQGMRDTLYFKDDDSRLSFLTGNYVTLTNMKLKDIERIIRYRMSPINISVHTTNPELRKFMLGNRFAGDVLDRIRMLCYGGITVNCQIVLCPGVNDAEELERTVSDLAELYPGIASISAVPVGITRYREKLYGLKAYEKESAGRVIKQVERLQAEYLNKFGSRIVYLADEFYLLAGMELPGPDYYEDFPQLENGVGLVTLFRQEFYNCLQNGSLKKPQKPRSISIATGVSAYGLIAELAQQLEKRFGNIKIEVFEIKNEFFGKNVTVSGLLTGQDISSQLSGRLAGNELLLSASMFRSDDSVFLDDMRTEDLERQLGVKVTPVENSGEDFINKILGKR